jgi:hypothetical protein
MLRTWKARRRAGFGSEGNFYFELRLTVAGIMREAEATAISDDIVEATVELNACSIPSAVPVRVL